MHHPFFFDYFYSIHADDGFRLGDEHFYLWDSGGIAAGPRGGFFVWLPTGINHSSNTVRASSTGRHKKQDGTNRSGFDVGVKSTGLRSCKQPENVLENNYYGGASGCLRSLLFWARSWPFGLFFFTCSMKLQNRCKDTSFLSNALLRKHNSKGSSGGSICLGKRRKEKI